VPRITPKTFIHPAAAPSLAQSKAIGIVREPYRAAKRGFQVTAQRAADQADGIGVLDEIGTGDKRPRDAHADGHFPVVVALDAANQRRHGRDGRLVIAGRGRDSLPGADAARTVNGGGLDFGPAQIDADAQPSSHLMARNSPFVLLTHSPPKRKSANAWRCAKLPCRYLFLSPFL
jgi:hypothetical protein